MHTITIPEREFYDESKDEFVLVNNAQTLRLEHSLVSISKWESKWHKPFLSKRDKTDEEIFDYIKCMTVSQNVDPNIYNYLTSENIKEINDYIDDPMTATTINKNGRKNNNRQIITNELIYSWMIQLNIPVEFEKWHINRLITLIEVCNAQNEPAKKKSKKETVRDFAAINAANRKRFNSKG